VAPKQAMYYTKDGDNIRCLLCPQNCVIKPGRTGLCRVRKNENGVLYSLNYARITALNMDPIEKKPLYHFYPGSRILSAGSYGCNLKCSFCQNYSIAHGTPDSVYISPKDLAERAVAAENSIGIAYTYNEPSIWYEYVLDTARLVKERGLNNVLVTNGYIKAEALKGLLPFIDAANVDIKAFSASYYDSICSGRLSPVLETVKRVAEYCHIEVTTLIVGGLNDKPDELDALGEWVAGINKEIPLHLSRYYPAYHMNRPPTPIEAIEAARDIVKKHLDYVYIGNVPGTDNNTYCPACGEKLVERDLYSARMLFDGRKCGRCGVSVNMTV
jgi:pyruvate formate lyase activating enzyme